MCMKVDFIHAHCHLYLKSLYVVHLVVIVIIYSLVTVIHLLMLLLKGFSLALKMPLCLAGYFTCCITCYYCADLKCLQ